MQLYCQDCGQKAKPGDLLCADCGGALVEHDLDVPELAPADGGHTLGDDRDVGDLPAGVKQQPPAAPADQANRPAAVFDLDQDPPAASGAEEFDLGDLLETPAPQQAAPAAPTSPAAPAAPAPEEVNLDELLASPTTPAASVSAATAEEVSLNELLAAPTAPPVPAGAAAGAAIAELNEILAMPARRAPAPQPAPAPEPTPAAPPAPALGYLEADISGAVTRYPLEGEVLTIGRIDPGVHKPTVDLSRDDAVSRKHAEIRIRDQEVLLVDANSTNGTRLNGVPCAAQQEYPLCNGDKITLGEKCTLTIHL